MKSPHRILLPAGLLGIVTSSSAQTPSTWNAGTGFWYDTVNWSNNVVPNSSSVDVIVDGNTGTGSIVTFGYNAAVGVEYGVGRLRIDAGDRMVTAVVCSKEARFPRSMAVRCRWEARSMAATAVIPLRMSR